MTNEAVIVELLGQNGDPISYTCADGVGIAKGTLLWMTDPRTVSGASIAALGSSPKAFAGIANAEKVASDGSTKIGIYTNGIFDLTTVPAPTVTIGDQLVISGINLVAPTIAGSLSGSNLGCIVGTAMETGIASEVIQVRVNL